VPERILLENCINRILNDGKSFIFRYLKMVFDKRDSPIRKNRMSRLNKFFMDCSGPIEGGCKFFLFGRKSFSLPREFPKKLWVNNLCAGIANGLKIFINSKRNIPFPRSQFPALPARDA